MHALSAAAATWDQRGRSWFHLLHGRTIAEAEHWLDDQDGARRRPTELQRRYIETSRRFSRRWRQAVATSLAVFAVTVGILMYFERRSIRTAEARELAARAVQLRNNDQSALTESTLMLIAATRDLASLGVRSPEIEAMLRETARLLLPVRGAGRHPGGVGGMTVASRGTMIATYAFSRTASVSGIWEGHVDTTVRLWDVPSSQPFATLRHDGPVATASFDDDQRLVTGTINGALSIWDLRSVRAGITSPFVTEALDGAVLSTVSAASRAYTASSKGSVCAWNTATGSQLWCVRDANQEGVILALSVDGQYVAAGGAKGFITIRATRNGRTIAMISDTSGGDIDTLVFSPESNQIAFGDTKGKFEVWALPRAVKQLSFLHRDAVTSAAYSPRGQPAFIATCSTDRSLRILNEGFSAWRIDEFRFDYALWQLAIDPSGRFIAVARGDGYVDVWSREEERIVGRIRIETGDVPTGLAFLPGDLLAVVDGGEGVRFLAFSIGREVTLLSAQGIEDVAVSATGFVLTDDSFGTSGGFRPWMAYRILPGFPYRHLQRQHSHELGIERLWWTSRLIYFVCSRSQTAG